MLDEIYNKRVLELAADIPRLGRLAAPDATAKAHSRLCGSTVTVDLCVRDGGSAISRMTCAPARSARPRRR